MFDHLFVLLSCIELKNIKADLFSSPFEERGEGHRKGRGCVFHIIYQLPTYKRDGVVFLMTVYFCLITYLNKKVKAKSKCGGQIDLAKHTPSDPGLKASIQGDRV